MAGPPVDGGKAPRIPEQGNVLQRMINVPAVWQVCWALLVVAVSDRNRQPGFQLPQVALWTVLFYFSSAVSGMMNKQIIADYGILPTTLTMWHLLISVACDSCVVWALGQAKVPSGKTLLGHTTSVMLQFLPIALFIIGGKLATYFSYNYVSMALTHTAKALEPVFNVVLSAVFFGEYKSFGVYVSLVPIALGVGIASTSEMSYNHIGFAAASLSAALKVLQNIYTKRVMGKASYSFFEIHLFCGAASALTLVPVSIVEQLSAAGVDPSALGPADAALAQQFPGGLLLVDSALQYLSSISSYMVLSLVAHLTFTIVNSMKRVCMAVGGVFLYNLVRPKHTGPAGKGPDSSSAQALQLLAVHTPGGRVSSPRDTPLGTPYEAAAAMVMTDKGSLRTNGGQASAFSPVPDNARGQVDRV
ncbi:PPT1 [Symbiodinium sp. KB8]|nr:PPT1 [Symbiodinium sp. KB8]